MRKQTIQSMVAALLVAGILAGCGTANNGKSGSSSGNEPVTITYMTFSATPDHLQELDKIVAAFEEQHPNIKVQVVPVAYNDYFTKLQAAITGSTPPDTFELNYENFVTYAKKGVLLDLTSRATADKLDTILAPKAYQAFNYNGQQLGLVETFSTVVLFYNKDLFDKAGLAYPDETWTWEDELEAARKLTDPAAGVWGSYQPVQFNEFYKVAAQNGGKIIDGDKVVINSPENVEALQYLVDRILKEKIQPTEAEMAGQGASDLFMAGKLAMVHTGIWMFSNFKDAPFNWDIAPEPGNKQKAAHFFANAVVVSKNTQHPDEAYEWAKFLATSPEAAKIRVDSNWEVPAVADTSLVESYLKQTPPAHRQVVFDALEYPVVPPVLDQWEQETDVINRQLEAAMLGKISPAEALANAQKELEALLK